MGLKDFLGRKDVKKLFSDTFKTPKIESDIDIKAPPLTKKPGLIGTAFDYLVDIHVKYYNPEAVFDNCMPEKTLSRMELLLKNNDKHKLGLTIQDYNQAKSDFDFAVKSFNKFLSNGKLDYHVLTASVYLAYLDNAFYKPIYYKDHRPSIENDDLKDFENMINATNFNLFKSSSHFLINANFNEANKIIAKAEADLVIDNKLVDLKTNKKLTITRDMLNQILCYYILAKIGGVSNKRIDGSSVTHIGFYFARYGKLYTYHINDLINYRKLSDVKKNQFRIFTKLQTQTLTIFSNALMMI